MITQYRTVWRKSRHDNDRHTIWRSDVYEHDRNAESLRQCGHLVLREERREVLLVIPQTPIHYNRKELSL